MAAVSQSACDAVSSRHGVARAWPGSCVRPAPIRRARSRRRTTSRPTPASRRSRRAATRSTPRSAANFVLGVVVPYLCGYGGDVLAMVWDGSLHGYIGAGRAPQAATVAGVRDRNDERLSPMGDMPTFGPHAVTVPGAPRGWFDLLERWGSRSFGDLAQPALRYAEHGFPLTRRGAGDLHALPHRVRPLRTAGLRRGRTRRPSRATGCANLRSRARSARSPRRVPTSTTRVRSATRSWRSCRRTARS